MKKQSRFLCMLLVLCLAIGMFQAAAFATGSKHPFKDVAPGAWYNDSVQYVYENELMNGITQTKFEPDGLTTRGMLVTVLYRMEGSPAAAGNGFADVEPGSWYEAAVLWAKANDIVNGYSSNTFAPHDPITREQLATIFYRYVSYKGYDTSARADLNVYADGKDVSGWAKEAMSWAVSVGLIQGVGNSLLAYSKDATRAQIATILMRFQKDVESELPKLQQFTVSFDSNGGSEVDSQLVYEGTCVVVPKEPTREGYKFAGWYADAALTVVYDFTKPVFANMTLYADWEATSGNPDDANDEEDTEVSEGDEYILTASESEIYAGSPTEVIFYVNSTLTVPSFELFADGTSTGVHLYDDGDYYSTGDDIPNDGCYTGLCEINLDAEGEVTFTAKATVGETVVTTNGVDIFVYYELTDEQFDVMNNVDESLDALVAEAKTKAGGTAEVSALVAEIRSKTDPFMQQLKEYGIISELTYSDEACMYSWAYTETGVEAGYIIYDPYENDDTMKGRAERETTTSTSTKTVSVNTTYSKGSVVILNNYVKSNGWNVTYDACADELEEAGFDVTCVYAFTVDDFKNLEDYNSLILVNSHGNTHNGKKSGRPCICTDEAVSDGKYSSDLKQNRIRRVNGKYWIEPKFFEDYYGDNYLSDPIFYLGICRGYANDRLVSVLDDVGAGAVLGYSASVSVSYDNKMVRTLVDRLIAGDDADEALAYAKEQHGQQDPSRDDDWEKHAVLGLYDNAYDNLYHQLLNGNFDSVFNWAGSRITAWSEYGDARSIFKLSGIIPRSAPKMAIISSGFGSMNDETTSCIYQTILVPEDANMLTFSYDIVSEEPMEFVGTNYDDIFQVDILSTDGELLATVAYESVNTSSWYAVDGINFPGGDETTYHTRWITVNKSISAYRGKLIVLRFAVQDTGDAIYDTAALIDSVSIS